MHEFETRVTKGDVRACFCTPVPCCDEDMQTNAHHEGQIWFEGAPLSVGHPGRDGRPVVGDRRDLRHVEEVSRRDPRRSAQRRLCRDTQGQERRLSAGPSSRRHHGRTCAAGSRWPARPDQFAPAARPISAAAIAPTRRHALCACRCWKSARRSPPCSTRSPWPTCGRWSRRRASSKTSFWRYPERCHAASAPTRRRK